MSKYKKLAVETHWPLVKEKDDANKYFPDYPENIYPSFDDFWNVKTFIIFFFKNIN